MEQAVSVRGAGPGVAGPPGQEGQPGKLVDQVRAEQAEVPVLGMLVVQPGLQHDRVEREHPGMVGDEQRAAAGRHVVEPAHLDPEPLLVQQPGQRDQQPGVELRVETELVDLALAGDLAPGEPQRLGQAAAPVVAGCPAGGAGRRWPGHRHRGRSHRESSLGPEPVVMWPFALRACAGEPFARCTAPGGFPVLRCPLTVSLSAAHSRSAPGRPPADLPPTSRPRGPARCYFLFRRCTRVFRSSLRCFFFAIRLRRFLITEPTTPPSLGIQANRLATYSPDASRLGPRQRPRVPAPRPSR